MIRTAAFVGAIALGPLARGHAQVELTLHPYVANLRTLVVRTGKDTASFLLDTGGGFTVVTPELARKIGCEPFGRVTGFRSTGERMDAPRCGPVSLDLGGRTVRTEAGVLDLMALLKGAPPIDGVVSLETLQSAPFTLDLRANRLVLETRASFARWIRGMTPLSVRTSRQAGGASVDLFLEVTTPGGPIWLELDSGNAGPVLLSPHALVQLGLAPEGEGTKRATLELPRLGAFPVEFETKDLIYDGLLNAAFLESIVLAVDLRSGRAWASRRP